MSSSTSNITSLAIDNELTQSELQPLSSPAAAMAAATAAAAPPASQPSQSQPQKKHRFRCTEPGCTRTFNRKYTLSEHSKTHTGEKPHVCPVKSCGKRFTTSGNLSRHKRLHGPMLPIACPVTGCECSFSSDSKLEKHMAFHFGTAEHACVVPGCGKTFSTFGNHNRHMRNQHTREERSLVSRWSMGDAGGSSVGTRSPSGSDEWSQSCESNSEDENQYEHHSWVAASSSAAPLTNYEPQEPWNPEMLEALSLILEEKMVIPEHHTL